MKEKLPGTDSVIVETGSLKKGNVYGSIGKNPENDYVSMHGDDEPPAKVDSSLHTEFQNTRFNGGNSCPINLSKGRIIAIVVSVITVSVTVTLTAVFVPRSPEPPSTVNTTELQYSTTAPYVVTTTNHPITSQSTTAGNSHSWNYVSQHSTEDQQITDATFSNTVLTTTEKLATKSISDSTVTLSTSPSSETKSIIEGSSDFTVDQTRNLYSSVVTIAQSEATSFEVTDDVDERTRTNELTEMSTITSKSSSATQSSSTADNLETGHVSTHAATESPTVRSSINLATDVSFTNDDDRTGITLVHTRLTRSETEYASNTGATETGWDTTDIAIEYHTIDNYTTEHGVSSERYTESSLETEDSTWTTNELFTTAPAMTTEPTFIDTAWTTNELFTTAPAMTTEPTFIGQQFFPKYYVTGGINLEGNYTLDECIDECQALSNCLGVDYYYPYWQCMRHVSSEIKTNSCEPLTKDINYDHWEKLGCPSFYDPCNWTDFTFIAQESFDIPISNYSGGYLYEYKSVNGGNGGNEQGISMDKCINCCKSQSACYGVDHVITHGQCYFHTQNTCEKFIYNVDAHHWEKELCNETTQTTSNVFTTDPEMTTEAIFTEDTTEFTTTKLP